MEDLVHQVKAFGMPAVALTDAHNLFGAIDFYQTCQKQGIQPIIGCEVDYIADPQAVFSLSLQANKAGLRQATHSLISRHLVLLCRHLDGYRNLCELLTRSYSEKIPQTASSQQGPRAFVTQALLDEWGDGLVVLSGCLKGELSYAILMGEEEKALTSLKWFQQRFGEFFFLELQDAPLPEQDQVNRLLFQWSQQYGIPCVATSDCHYLNPAQAEAHEVLQCIEDGKTLDFERPPSLVPAAYCLKSAEEMNARFACFPGAFENTLKVAAACQFEFTFRDQQGKPIYHLPSFRPEGVSPDSPFDLEAFFKEQAAQGLEKRFLEPALQKKLAVAAESATLLKEGYYKRLHEELEMIARTGFSGYFLIVADFINWAKQQKIPVGPGRGSGAGSLVAYSLGITNIDPIAFHLLFERFINPERISMPDFDIDFCQDRRQEVIQYVEQKYGKKNVCQIVTFGKLQARAVVKDVGRVFGLSFAEMDQLTKLFPAELDLTLERALEAEPRLREKIEKDTRFRKIFEYSKALEGLYRNTGVHAAGVIMTEKPIVHYCPLMQTKEGDWVTQFDKDFAEAIGLIKFDFLGLKTLTVIDHTVRLIQQNDSEQEKHFSIDAIPDNDAAVFALISSGDTDGIFQIESSGMKDLCARIQPNSLEDLTAINALYRPGPLGSGMVDDFIDRKHGRKPILYEHPSLESILKETYGVILYQEQVMRIARELAGYSLGQADLLRRAMGKKKPEEMAKHRELFVTGALKKGFQAHEKHKAEALFDLMAKFAEYGFNKSHSAAYGVLTYQTAYLKTHYATEFMAALMTTEMDHTEKLAKYLADAKWHGLPLLSPDVSQSQKHFSVEWLTTSSSQKPTKAIRFGLGAIKGVGSVAVETILEARQQRPFQSLLDFAKRVSARKVNKKVIEALCAAGAFDALALKDKVNRGTLWGALEKLLIYGSEEQAEKELGQASLFDQFSAESIQLMIPTDSIFVPQPDWSLTQRLVEERKVLGFYLSGHPLQQWQPLFDTWFAVNGATLLQKSHSISARHTLQWGGMVTHLREVTTKKGGRMGFVQAEDSYGRLEAVCFPEVYQQSQSLLTASFEQAEPLVFSGELEQGEEAPKLIIKQVQWAHELHQKRKVRLQLLIPVEQVSVEQLRDLKRCLMKHRGKCALRLVFESPDFSTFLDLPKNFYFSQDPEALLELQSLFGKKSLSVIEEGEGEGFPRTEGARPPKIKSDR